MNHGKIVTVLQYFTDKVDDYWHIVYPITLQKEREKDEYLYFYDLSRKALDYRGEFSDNGIYKFLGYDGKYHIHALELSQYSLACWLAWNKTKNNMWLDKAMLHCDWLVENQELDGAWRTQHKNPVYKDLPTPWPSALTQGLAISSLIRAYYYTKDDKYLTVARKACNFFTFGIKGNGVKRYFTKDDISGFIYEEYPQKKLSGVLNGYIAAIFGILELSYVDAEYKILFIENMDNLKKILPLYDNGYWSYYSLDGNIDSGFYHRLIIKQIKVLSEFDNELNYFYKQFYMYQNNMINATRALISKIKYKL